MKKYSRFNRKTTDEYISEALIVHKGIYNYELVKYKNYCSFIQIICRNHGIFSLRADTHLKGAICPECKNENQRNERNLGIDNFIKKKQMKFIKTNMIIVNLFLKICIPKLLQYVRHMDHLVFNPEAICMLIRAV